MITTNIVSCHLHPLLKVGAHHIKRDVDHGSFCHRHELLLLLQVSICPRCVVYACFLTGLRSAIRLVNDHHRLQDLRALPSLAFLGLVVVYVDSSKWDTVRAASDISVGGMKDIADAFLALAFRLGGSRRGVDVDVFAVVVFAVCVQRLLELSALWACGACHRG